MTEVHFRQPTLADADELAQLGAMTFVQSFGHCYSEDDLQAFLASNFDPKMVAAAIDSAPHCYRLACRENRMIGYARIGPLKLPIEPRDEPAGELYQLYLDAEERNSGTGRLLLQWALNALQEQGYRDVYLGVWTENPGAQRFYRRFGFVPVGTYYFPVGNQRDLEIIMRLDTNTDGR